MSDNRVSVTLPLDGNWLVFVHNSLQMYAERVGLSPTIEKMCSHSVMEAYEELLRLAKRAGISESITLQFDYKGETIVIDIEYSARIPLNPHKIEEYEVPDAKTDLDDLNLDTLWLHLIKRRMDRVHFKVKGSRHVLRMVKYRRDEGKERQLWIMAIKPELRKGLFLHLSEPDAAHPTSTLQAIGGGVLNLGPSETFMIRNMDGKLSFHDLYMAHIDSLGLISPKMLAELYEKLENLGMLVNPNEELRDTRFRRIVKRIVNPDVSIPNADV